jgi:hypothetical protein
MFPKLLDGGFRGPQIVESSSGEIDAVCSLNYEEIYLFQQQDKSMFLHYFCDTFNEIIKLNLYDKSDEFKTKWQNTDLIVCNNHKPRTPWELPVQKDEYFEYKEYKYI